MTEARLIRRTRFTASHHYRRSDWSEEENRRAFGVQMDPHRHDWMVEVHVAGPADEATGFVVDLEALDALLASAMTGWDGGDLNTVVPEVADGSLQPSTENLACLLYRTLEGRLPAQARVVEVAVFESPDLGARYPA
jgi:6-pyruvoyltetrahydropterin/6-carboxytetrahydropterin synthase